MLGEITWPQMQLGPLRARRALQRSRSSGTMDSYLLGVSGVSSCLQRSQIEFKEEGDVISVVGEGGGGFLLV